VTSLSSLPRSHYPNIAHCCPCLPILTFINHGFVIVCLTSLSPTALMFPSRTYHPNLAYWHLHFPSFVVICLGCVVIFMLASHSLASVSLLRHLNLARHYPHGRPRQPCSPLTLLSSLSRPRHTNLICYCRASQSSPLSVWPLLFWSHPDLVCHHSYQQSPNWQSSAPVVLSSLPSHPTLPRNLDLPLSLPLKLRHRLPDLIFRDHVVIPVAHAPHTDITLRHLCLATPPSSIPASLSYPHHPDLARHHPPRPHFSQSHRYPHCPTCLPRINGPI
jgi:hypothetical protein